MKHNLEGYRGQVADSDIVDAIASEGAIDGNTIDLNGARHYLNSKVRRSPRLVNPRSTRGWIAAGILGAVAMFFGGDYVGSHGVAQGAPIMTIHDNTDGAGWFESLLSKITPA